ncbi:MAG: DUF3788 domain-containing protein [Candidatus Hodarchaeales archaeon]
MINKEQEPTKQEILETIGQKSSLWLDLRKYLEENYDFLPEKIFYGKKYGWTIRYRKSGKTLCSLFPEKDSYTVLITLGKKEVEKTNEIIETLNPEVKTLFKETKQLRDGRWLWISVRKSSDIKSIKVLLKIKRKPKHIR